MKINGLVLPEQYAQHVIEKTFQRATGSWLLKQTRDGYGNPLETELNFFASFDDVQAETNKLSDYFNADGDYGSGHNDWQHEPHGFIEDITDFTHIVCFAESGDGAPFCFDYRENLQQPAVIWWDDTYWRNIAPTYQAFIMLFDLSER